ncbi:chemotaxis protein CheY [Burkholderia paludis]|uniref:response regulator n=1 Tax=Burkholderia paludis TaxID=1506587 RepID=UPI0004DB53FB|nr:response regulator [Burkholderia paludis]KFG95096.1 chemotaxis protein CheY [Burkholderia paludis]
MNDTLRRILCAEDDPDIRTILDFSLATLGGYELCLCADGTDALDQADAFAPDLVLLDVMMPTLGGPETMRALRARPALRDTPIVLMSARALPDEIEALLAHGATGVIVKPFDPVALPDNLKIYWNYAHDRRAGDA